MQTISIGTLRTEYKELYYCLSRSTSIEQPEGASLSSALGTTVSFQNFERPPVVFSNVTPAGIMMSNAKYWRTKGRNIGDGTIGGNRYFITV